MIGEESYFHPCWKFNCTWYRCLYNGRDGVGKWSKRLPVPYLPSGEMPYEPDSRRRSGKVGTLGSGSKTDYRGM